MKLSDDASKYTSSWKYLEVARYIPSLNRVIREKFNGNPVLLEKKDLQKYADKYNNTGIYTSVWHYDNKDLSKSTRLGSLYFDIDNNDMSISLEECKKLYLHLLKFIPEESIIVYYTGKKGFHIECEAIALGINPSNSLHETFRYIANDINKKLQMTSLDFSIYDQRRMWRLPGSAHQETGLYKNCLNKNMLFSSIEKIVRYCSASIISDIKEQSFSPSANEWYRQYVYKIEEEKNRPKDILAYFNEYGSKGRVSFDDSEKVFDKKQLLANCSAITRIEKEAKENKHIDHESRLFLCSVLTYTEDAVVYLHEILSHCDDYNFEKSSSHINDWIKRRELGIGGRPYTCKRANAAGVGCGDCSLEEKNKWVKIGAKFVETNEKNSPSPVRFAYAKTKKGGTQDD